MKLAQLTIRQKVTLLASFIAIVVAAIIGSISLYSAKQAIAERMLHSELPAKVEAINNHISNEINTLLNASEQLASSAMVARWAQTQGRADDALLIQQLQQVAQQYDLATASWANRNSGEYWNQDGFLRVLTAEQDGWFFAFKDSAQPRSISIYQEAPGDVKMFVNYQQVGGLGLSGLAKSIDDMQQMLERFTIEKSGFVYVVNSQGLVQLHPDAALVAKATLEDIYQQPVSTALLGNEFAITELNLHQSDYFVAASPITNTDLYVIAQVPADEVFASVNALMWQIVMISIVVAALMCVAGFVLATNITAPIKDIARRFIELGQGQARLDHRFDALRQPELRELTSGFNEFLSKIDNAIKAVAQQSQQVGHSASELRQQAGAQASSLEEQKQQTISVATAANQMEATVAEIANNAASAASLTAEGQQHNEFNRTQVADALAQINSLAQGVEQMSEELQELVAKTSEISDVVSAITGISEQTNLLALNAAIESARAGEHGRGFAVVADEVRALASRTSSSTAQIQRTIDSLNDSANNMVARMEQARSGALRSVEIMEQSSTLLNDNAKASEQINDITTIIATATEEQSSVMSDVSRQVELISSASDAIAMQSADVKATVTTLHECAEQLDALVASFDKR